MAWKNVLEETKNLNEFNILPVHISMAKCMHTKSRGRHCARKGLLRSFCILSEKEEVVVIPKKVVVFIIEEIEKIKKELLHRG